MTHDYFRSLPGLFDDRQVVLYDRFGTGNSSRRPEWDAQEWTVDLFLDQLRGLLAHRGLTRASTTNCNPWHGVRSPNTRARSAERH
jgi:pimeloyl-ACP methyl ester carboxylesterase